MLRILHVDDCEDELLLTKLNLAKRADDLEIEWALSAKPALKKLRASDFDCILSDYQLPEINGLQFLQRLRKSGVETPFIFLTGQGSEEVAASALHNGADDYFSKNTGPVYYERLLNSIRRLVNAHRQLLEHQRAEEALQRSEIQYLTTLNAMDDAIHIVDPHLRILLFNDAFKNLSSQLGLPTEAIGRDLFEVFPFLGEQVRREYEEAFEAGRIVVTEERTEVAGREFFTRTSKIPVLANGLVDSVVTVVRDISREKRLERALQQLGELDEELEEPLPPAQTAS